MGITLGLETDGPSSSLESTAGLTSISLESMIPVNTPNKARARLYTPVTLTAQVSVERGENMIDSEQTTLESRIPTGKDKEAEGLKGEERVSALHSLAN